MKEPSIFFWSGLIVNLIIMCFIRRRVTPNNAVYYLLAVLYSWGGTFLFVVVEFINRHPKIYNAYFGHGRKKK